MVIRRLTKCEQHEINELNYVAFHEDAEVRLSTGEKAYKCAECGLYQWPRR